MDKEKRVLIITNNSGGLYSFRRDLILELKKRSEVIVSTPFDDHIKELVDMNCHLIQTEFERRGINPFKDFLLFLRYVRLLINVHPDIVITYTIKPNTYGAFACRLMHVPYAVNITGLGTAFEREGMLKRLVVCMYRCALKNAKVVYFENSANEDTFIKESITNRLKTCVLSGAGVNLNQFKFQPYPDNKKFTFLFIGRLMKEKGINELFEAMKKLVDKGSECYLDILGSLEEDYQDDISKYEKEGWLKYHGVQQDVRPYIKKCDCFVLPSWHEGMANTNLECAASGRPIITSNIPGCREAVINGVTGFLCEPQNVDSLYHKMEQMMEKAREDREKMGKAARKHMESVFDKNKVVNTTIERLF